MTTIPENTTPVKQVVQGTNTRTLAELALAYRKPEGETTFQKGEILIEIKARCKAEGRSWLDWITEQFRLSHDTASNQIRVARRGQRFRKFRNLGRLGKTVLYDLARHEPQDELPTIIAELEKHPNANTPHDAWPMIFRGIGRHRYGDRPDPTLDMLARLDEYHNNEPWYERAHAALLKLNPDTDEAAEAIVTAAKQEQQAGEQVPPPVQEAINRDIRGDDAGGGTGSGDTGSAEGAAEGSAEGAAEGSAKGSAEGSAKGSGEGRGEGPPQQGTNKKLEALRAARENYATKATNILAPSERQKEFVALAQALNVKLPAPPAEAPTNGAPKTPQDIRAAMEKGLDLQYAALEHITDNPNARGAIGKQLADLRQVIHDTAGRA